MPVTIELGRHLLSGAEEITECAAGSGTVDGEIPNHQAERRAFFF
jgi:hypothetical protein